MSATNTLETAILALLFNATTLAGLAQDIAGSPSGDPVLYVSLHTADPGEAGDQSTSETSYGQYQRIAVIRTSAGWTVSGNTVSNTAEILFNEATSGTPTLTHFGIGRSPTGAGTLLFKGALNSSLAISAGIQPRFQAGQLTVTAD
jgi:hypothetical protein